LLDPEVTAMPLGGERAIVESWPWGVRQVTNAARLGPAGRPERPVAVGVADVRVKGSGRGRRPRSRNLAKGNDHGRQELELAQVRRPRSRQEGRHAGHRTSAGPAELTQ